MGARKALWDRANEALVALRLAVDAEAAPEVLERLDQGLDLYDEAANMDVDTGPDPYKRWTITIEDDDSEAITIYAANSHESDLFIGRLVELADLSAYGETTSVANPDGPRGEPS